MVLGKTQIPSTVKWHYLSNVLMTDGTFFPKKSSSTVRFKKYFPLKLLSYFYMKPEIDLLIWYNVGVKVSIFAYGYSSPQAPQLERTSLIAHTCDPSYSGDEHRRIEV
jgi:hypothetical protein